MNGPAMSIPPSTPASVPLDIIPSTSLEALLGKRDAAIACLRQIREAVEAYQQIATHLKLGEGYDAPTAHYKWGEAISARTSRLGSDDWLPDSARTVDAALWEHLLAMSGERTFMDAEARKKWAEAIAANNVPELTAENVRATFQGIHEKRGDFFQRGVTELFRSLSWDYKSNKPQMFGRKVIIQYVMEVAALGGHPNYRTCQTLDDMMRAFCILDGKPEPDHRQGAYHALSLAHKAGSSTWETPYFRLQTYKNGNGHATLTRPDLVQELNRVLHRAHPDALPAQT